MAKKIALLALIFILCLSACGNDLDNQKIAKSTCEQAVAKLGYSGEFVYRINKQDDGLYVGLLTLTSSTGPIGSWSCVYDPETEIATVESI